MQEMAEEMTPSKVPECWMLQPGTPKIGLQIRDAPPEEMVEMMERSPVLLLAAAVSRAISFGRAPKFKEPLWARTALQMT